NQNETFIDDECVENPPPTTGENVTPPGDDRGGIPQLPPTTGENVTPPGDDRGNIFNNVTTESQNATNAITSLEDLLNFG
ncbi:MAG: hypothetical protein L0H53_11625, partial [Candidatus Nitrosocosmicus sp.]|nr:hypothetical protein [Candidatus Nitrosocosmicus sp.]